MFLGSLGPYLTLKRFQNFTPQELDIPPPPAVKLILTKCPLFPEINHLKTLFHSSHKPTCKLVARTLVQYVKALAASLQVGFCDEWKGSLKALFNSSQKSTRKLAVGTFIQSQYLKALAASLRVGVCDK